MKQLPVKNWATNNRLVVAGVAKVTMLLNWDNLLNFLVHFIFHAAVQFSVYLIFVLWKSNQLLSEYVEASRVERRDRMAHIKILESWKEGLVERELRSKRDLVHSQHIHTLTKKMDQLRDIKRKLLTLKEYTEELGKRPPPLTCHSAKHKHLDQLNETNTG